VLWWRPGRCEKSSSGGDEGNGKASKGKTKGKSKGYGKKGKLNEVYDGDSSWDWSQWDWFRKDELQKLVGLIKVGQIRLGMDIRGIVKDGISGMTKVGVQP